MTPLRLAAPRVDLLGLVPPALLRATYPKSHGRAQGSGSGDASATAGGRRVDRLGLVPPAPLRATPLGPAIARKATLQVRGAKNNRASRSNSGRLAGVEHAMAALMGVERVEVIFSQIGTMARSSI